ncbi:MAG TPA: citrate synthase [Polyangiales bacterium]|nr:citrate synthase [Polyangiales bacterium]
MIHNGLEGVVVAQTELSHVDGERGQLILRGHHVEQLAPEATLEDVAHLLWTGRLPVPEEHARVQARLYAGRARAFAVLPRVRAALETQDAMDALRGATAQLSAHDSQDLAGLLCGAQAVFAAAHARLRAGLDPIAPAAERSQAADYLAMLHGVTPDPARVRALDSYLVTVSDHGLNASTFAARVVTSTGSDDVSALVAGIGALKGPLHGGAPGEVLDMLDEIDSADRAERWLAAAVARGERIPGMGHRIYRVRDPRAAVLESAIDRLSRALGKNARLELAKVVEAAAVRVLDARYPERKLRANVEFNTAVILEAIGVPRALFTATFAIGRAVGWVGHIEEQRRTGRLIRPAAEYVGPWPKGS